MKFNWVTFKVSSMEKSVFFYTKLLGLEIASHFESNGNEITMLGQAEGPKIELICDKSFKNEHPVKGVTVGLEIDELDKMVEKLKENGLNVSGPISPNPHIRFFFVKDPDGYNIQLVEQK